MKLGRPTTYTPELGDIVCEGIASGKPLVKICESDSLPEPRSIYRWLRENEDFRHNYEMAKDDMADYMADESIDISDNQASQAVLVDDVPLVLDGKPVMSVSAASVAHAKLRIETRKWYASKLKPKKYGDKIQQEVTGADGAALALAVNFVSPLIAKKE